MRASRNFLVMIGATIAVGWLAARWLGTIAGIAIGVLFFAGWFRFNFRASTTGLFKANLRAYFAYRRSGESVEAAIESMVKSRYPFSKERQLVALEFVRRLQPRDTESGRVSAAVLNIFLFEQGAMITPDQIWDKSAQYEKEIAALYERLSSRVP